MDGRVPMEAALGVHLLRGAAESQAAFAFLLFQFEARGSEFGRNRFVGLAGKVRLSALATSRGVEPLSPALSCF